MTTLVNSRHVLLLNVGFQPLQAITIRHAVELMMRDAVWTVDGVAAQLRTPSQIFEVPSVLRLKYYVRVPSRVSWTPRRVLKRDQYTCIYCGKHGGEGGMKKSDFTIDHIRPKSRGGHDTWSNTACACWKCNNFKADRMPHEAGMDLRWEPKRPRVNYLIASGNVPAEWKFYLKTG